VERNVVAALEAIESAVHGPRQGSCASGWKSSTDALRFDARRVADTRSRFPAILLEASLPHAASRCAGVSATGGG